MHVFISYTREHRKTAAALKRDLKAAGYPAWYDKKLPGGVDWWKDILKQIQNSRALLFLVTRDSIWSEPCKKEREWASALNIPILPVRVDAVSEDMLPAELGKLQFVDYREGDRSLLDVLRAIKEFPEEPKLPDPLPPAPTLPVSPLVLLAEEVRSGDELPLKKQQSIVDEIRRLLDKGGSREDIRELLLRFAAQPYLFKSVGEEIDELLPLTEPERPKAPPQGPPTAPRKSSPLPGAIVVGIACGLASLWSWLYTDIAGLVATIAGGIFLLFAAGLVVWRKLREVAVERIGFVALVLLLLGATARRGTVELDNRGGEELRYVSLQANDGKDAKETTIEPGEKQRINFWFETESVVVKVRGLPKVSVRLQWFGRQRLIIPDSFRERPVVLIRPAQKLAELAGTKRCQLAVFLDGEQLDVTQSGYDGDPCWIGCAADVEVPPGLTRAGDNRRIALLPDETLEKGKEMEVRLLVTGQAEPLAVGKFTVREGNPKDWPQVVDLDLP